MAQRVKSNINCAKLWLQASVMKYLQIKQGLNLKQHGLFDCLSKEANVSNANSSVQTR